MEFCEPRLTSTKAASYSKELVADEGLQPSGFQAISSYCSQTWSTEESLHNV
jgi:hypothetical protein